MTWVLTHDAADALSNDKATVFAARADGWTNFHEDYALRVVVGGTFVGSGEGAGGAALAGCPAGSSGRKRYTMRPFFRS